MDKERLCNVVLENGVEFTEIDRINVNNNLYSILADLNNPNDFCIKKIINGEYLCCIDKEEFDNVLKMFACKYANKN